MNFCGLSGTLGCKNTKLSRGQPESNSRRYFQYLISTMYWGHSPLSHTHSSLISITFPWQPGSINIFYITFSTNGLRKVNDMTYQITGVHYLYFSHLYFTIINNKSRSLILTCLEVKLQYFGKKLYREPGIVVIACLPQRSGLVI